jgi:hypothetical protein
MRAKRVVHRPVTLACCLYPPSALPLFCPTLPCHTLCLTLCLAHCPVLCVACNTSYRCENARFARISSCSLRLLETKRSLRFASMLMKRSERFVLCERSERFVLCERRELFIDLLRSHVVSTFLWPCLCFVLPPRPCHALPYVLPCHVLSCPVLPCPALHYVLPIHASVPLAIPPTNTNMRA